MWIDPSKKAPWREILLGRKVRGTCFHLSNSIGHNSLWVFINGEAAETQASSLLPVGSSGLRGKVIWGVKSAVPINQGVGTKRKMETYNEKKKQYFWPERKRNYIYHFVHEQNWKTFCFAFQFERQFQVLQYSFEFLFSEMGNCRRFTGIKSSFVSLPPPLLRKACCLLPFSLPVCR